jgi:hypothetical protein
MEEGLQRMERFGDVPNTGFAEGAEPHVMFLRTVLRAPAAQCASAAIRHGEGTLLVTTGDGVLEVLRDLEDGSGGLEVLFEEPVPADVLQLAALPVDGLPPVLLPPGAGHDLLLATSAGALSLLSVHPARHTIRPLLELAFPPACELSGGSSLWAGPMVDPEREEALALGRWMCVAGDGSMVAVAGRQTLLAVLPTAVPALRAAAARPPPSSPGSPRIGEHAERAAGAHAPILCMEELLLVEGDIDGEVRRHTHALPPKPSPLPFTARCGARCAARGARALTAAPGARAVWGARICGGRRGRGRLGRPARGGPGGARVRRRDRARLGWSCCKRLRGSVRQPPRRAPAAPPPAPAHAILRRAACRW